MLTDFFHKKKEIVEYFVALQIGSSSIGACVFTIKDRKANIVGFSHKEYSGDWKELIDATDQAITEAAKTIQLSSIKKAVFGFPPNFLEGDKIKVDKLPNLKKLTTELELIPSGFVVIPEAINFYLEEKEGGPQTVVLIGVSQYDLIVSLFRGGKLSSQTTINRSDKITSDIEKALDSFTDVEIFPSKILLYDGVDLSKIKEELLRYPWQDNTKFIHFPKIETLSYELCLTSVAHSAASELNRAMDGIDSLNHEEQAEQPKEEVAVTTQVNASELGFAKDEENFDTVTTPVKKRFKFSLPKISLGWFNLKLAFLGRNKLLYAVLIFVGLFIFGGYTFASYSLPKATLTLVVDPKLYEQEKIVSINPLLNSPSEETGEIPGKQISTQVSSSKSIPATGKKLVGDPSKGSVTIYNKTTANRTFDKGTKLTSKNLVFTIDSNIDIPAANESVEGLTYGKGTVLVTASKIGAEGNLVAQTEFVIEEFSTSSYSARNDQAFAGGTSREVEAVSSKDQDVLLKALTDELKIKAESEISQQLASGEKLLVESLSGEVVSRQFNHEVGEETKDLTLTLDIKYSWLVYQENDFAILMEKMVQNNIPEGYEFIPKETSVEVTSGQKDDNNNTRFNARFTARLFPKLDIESIKKEISGLSIKEVEDYMRSINSIAGYEVDVNSPFSLFTSKIPKMVKNISIEIKPR